MTESTPTPKPRRKAKWGVLETIDEQDNQMFVKYNLGSKEEADAEARRMAQENLGTSYTSVRIGSIFVAQEETKTKVTVS